jgi:hypothetical protein
MARILVIIGAVLAAWATVYALVYLFRYSGIAFLQNLTFWISPLAVTGWALGLLLIVIYYWVFSSIWLSGRSTGS